jgi:hypothetical protein
MGHDYDDKKSLLPFNLDQNPAPDTETGQDFERKQQGLTNEIMTTFLAVLPSNYVALTNGPWYTLQFQAIAEQLAAIQIVGQEINKDSDFDFTRPEFLWDVLGTIVFPQATERGGAPLLDGDIDYRAFLHKMVLLLLQGATAATLEEGAECLTDSQVVVVEKFLSSVQRDPDGAWTIDNQFEIELNVEGFPTGSDPFTFQDNLFLVMEALKPAHILCELSYVFDDDFRDEFGNLFDDSNAVTIDGGMQWQMEAYYYDDLRKNCYGAKEVTGTGDTLADRTLFSDPDVSFLNIAQGADLYIPSGVNTGRYKVIDVRAFPMGDDATPRLYTTSPTGLASSTSGGLTIEGDVVTDSSQNWALAVEGELLTILAGPNAGTYRLDVLLGPLGGPLGDPVATGPADEVRVAPTILRVDRRMDTASVTGQAYTVTVDRLGVRSPKTRTSEDVSSQFYL